LNGLLHLNRISCHTLGSLQSTWLWVSYAA
jgi:hypothetical protein